MDKRTILAFILIALVFLLMPLYNSLINPPSEETETATADSTATEQQRDTTAAPPKQEKPAEPTERQVPEPVRSFEEVNPRKTVVVETDLYRAVFTTRGAALTSFVLKNYSKYDGSKIDLAGLDTMGTLRLKTVAGRTSNESDYLVSERMNYAVDKDSLILTAADREGSLRFSWQKPSGEAEVVKTYRFDNGRYSVGLEVTMRNPDSLGCDKDYYLSWDSPMPITEASPKADNDYMKGFASFGNEILDFKKIDNKEGLFEEKGGTTEWVGSTSKYFVNAVISKSRPAQGFYINGHTENLNLNGESIDRKLIKTGLKMALENGGSVSDSFVVYAGPMDYFRLKKFKVGLEKMVSMGWRIIQPFSVAVLWLFIQLHKFIPNYGFVIIVFSILIKIVFFPLSRKSFSSMSRMQEIQPKLKEIQEKYKDDRNKLSTETMKLYKEHGVNPLGGCLPLLLQMPVFYALFTVFRSTIELRGADFILWIKDLSVMDPYYVLPIVMGITMFVQQKMTMKDPKQKMMVYLMPALFTFLFYRMPAGLVLYWTMYNVLSFAEQLYIKRGSRPVTQT